MGLIAVLSDSTGGGVTLGTGGSMEVVLGSLQHDATLGGIAVAIGLVTILAAGNLLAATDLDAYIRKAVVAASFPLLFVFALIVLDNSLQALGITISIGLA